jgi:undecaprenyl-diphosphatase
MKKKVRKNTNLQYIIIILAILALAMSIYAWQFNRFPWDLSLVTRLQSFDNATLRWVMEWVSYLGTSWRSALIVIICGFSIGWRVGILEGLLFPVAGIIVPLNYLLKLAVGQSRPGSEQVLILVPETGNSYPSGHAFFAALVLGLLGFLLFTHLRKTLWRVSSLAVIVFMILLIGLSRVYLGVHWPIDVLGGYLNGGFFLTCLIWFYLRTKAL